MLDQIATFIIASTLAAQPQSLKVSLEEYTCMAEAIHFEANGETEAGKIAVANVILNRANEKRFPSTICGVIQQGPTHGNGFPKKHRCQFSWWCDGRSDRVRIYNNIERESFEETALIAFKAVNGLLKDNTRGANHYYAHDKVTPFWSSDIKTRIIIGNHTFAKL